MKPVQDLTDRQKGLGPPEAPGFAAGRGLELAGVALSLLWIGLILADVLVRPSGAGGQSLVMTLMLLVLPVGLIWVTVITLRSVRALRAEAARLHATVEAMRASYAQAQAAQPPGKSTVERKIDEIAAVTRQTDAAVASFTSRRDAGLAAVAPDRRAAPVRPAPDPVPELVPEEPGLALGTPVEDLRPPLALADVIRALQFPETPEDKEGFRALRLALEDRTTARLIRAAQDVLTLLSQDGIYMDDLAPEPTRPEAWRRFAAGERGPAIGGLGAIHDRSALALTAGRMKADPVFRDAAHHFLRGFDRTFAAIEPLATDPELIELGNTRTARAFMLFGRVTGTFD
jgi:hypothetical protein